DVCSSDLCLLFVFYFCFTSLFWSSFFFASVLSCSRFLLKSKIVIFFVCMSLRSISRPLCLLLQHGLLSFIFCLYASSSPSPHLQSPLSSSSSSSSTSGEY